MTRQVMKSVSILVRYPEFTTTPRLRQIREPKQLKVNRAKKVPFHMRLKMAKEVATVELRNVMITLTT